MRKEDLMHDWEVEVPKGCSVLSNAEGEVAILYLSKRFGDMQPLSLKVMADSVEVLAIPHIVSQVRVTITKKIIIELADFVEEMSQ